MRYVAFLKAMNVGGHVVTMDRLRAIMATIGLPGAETFITSGNIVFDTKARGVGLLEQQIAQGMERSLGYPVPTFIRSAAAVAAICAYQPFPAKAMAAATVISVGFMAKPLEPDAVALMQRHSTTTDAFHTRGGEFYWMSQTKQSESPFFKVRFEKVFKTDITFRSLTTVRRIAATYCTGS